MKKKEKDDLHKWLNKTLSNEALELFKKTKTYQENQALVNYFEDAKIPEYNVNEEIIRLQNNKINTPPSSSKLLKLSLNKQWLKIAASLFIIVSIAYLANYTLNKKPLYATAVAENTSINLPDESIVHINAVSTLDYTPNHWAKDRLVTLEGEGYFEVAKGSTFKVNTSSGTIRVLGTKFNIKQRKNLFEVTCYEGLVEVEYKQNKYILKKGNYFSVINNSINYNKALNNTLTQPYWLKNRSYFKQIPLAVVFKDFEFHYDIKIKLDKKIDSKIKFTGGYSYNNTLEESLRSICIPFNFSFTKKNDTIYITQ